MKYYNFYISFENSIDTYNTITGILKVKPRKKDPSLFNQHLFDTWWYQVVEKEDASTFDFINSFLDLLEPNFEKLLRLGIAKSDILTWLVYEYDGQCSMEFHSQEMKRLGESGVSFNIDCHNADDNFISDK